MGVFYPYNRGSLYSALIFLYALTACVAGYVAASYYKQMEGEFWVRNILLTCFVYCGPFLVMFAFLNTVAIAYRVRRCCVSRERALGSWRMLHGRAARMGSLWVPCTWCHGATAGASHTVPWGPRGYKGEVAGCAMS